MTRQTRSLLVSCPQGKEWRPYVKGPEWDPTGFGHHQNHACTPWWAQSATGPWAIRLHSMEHIQVVGGTWNPRDGLPGETETLSNNNKTSVSLLHNIALSKKTPTVIKFLTWRLQKSWPQEKKARPSWSFQTSPGRGGRWSGRKYSARSDPSSSWLHLPLLECADWARQHDAGRVLWTSSKSVLFNA